MLDPYIGQINMVAFNYAPEGDSGYWAPCNGQLMSVNQNQALFSLLGTKYGGDGRINFALPDFRGRVPIHMGEGPGLTDYYDVGLKGGVEVVTLDETQLPSHTHASQPLLEVKIPAIASNANTETPNPNTCLGIGNKPSGMSADQIRNFSTATPTTSIMGGNVTGTVAIDYTGGNQPHSNMQPFLTVNFVIALQGAYPLRS